MPDARGISLPFDKAIQYFRQKIRLPTRTYQDLWQGMHARAFVVAGAARNELLADLFTAVEKGIVEGTTLEEFRRDFDALVEKSGWKYRGNRGWRTATIFNTNMRTAYQAGHYAQMTDSDVLAARPYLRYVASSSREPREEHMQWYNLVLPADDPWWDEHYPPNGWGCKCSVVNHSAREVEKLKKEEAGGPHPIKTDPSPDRHYQWVNPDTGEILDIPRGIDPGWDYHPGKAAWGEQLSEEAMAAWEKQGIQAWERLTPGNWENAGRTAAIPADPPVAKIGPEMTSIPAAARAIERAIGGREKIYSFAREGFRYDIAVDAESLARHLDLKRSAFIPFINETLQYPHEVWLSFEKHRGTGKVVLRHRIVKAVQIDKKRGLLIVAQARDGKMEAWTLVPTTDFKYLNRQREGKLLWAR